MTTTISIKTTRRLNRVGACGSRWGNWYSAPCPSGMTYCDANLAKLRARIRKFYPDARIEVQQSMT